MKYHKFDLEERTYQFAKRVLLLCKKLPRNRINMEYTSQVIRSSNSCSANYIEANESISKKDFLYRIRLSRKETKETILHLKLIQVANIQFKDEIAVIISEGIELIKIFSSIVNKCK